jgi:hypothetical protein
MLDRHPNNMVQTVLKKQSVLKRGSERSSVKELQEPNTRMLIELVFLTLISIDYDL